MFIYYLILKSHKNISKIYYTSTYFNGAEQTSASALSCLKVYAPPGSLIEYIPRNCTSLNTKTGINLGKHDFYIKLNDIKMMISADRYLVQRTKVIIQFSCS